jgi:hypothetical protein
MKAVTDDTLAALASACPNLVKVQLQGAGKIGEESSGVLVWLKIGSFGYIFSFELPQHDSLQIKS